MNAYPKRYRLPIREKAYEIDPLLPNGEVNPEYENAPYERTFVGLVNISDIVKKNNEKEKQK